MNDIKVVTGGSKTPAFMKRAAAPVEEAVRMRERCKGPKRFKGTVQRADDEPRFLAERLSWAYDADDKMPSLEAIRATANKLGEALLKRLTPQVTSAMMALMLSSMNKRISDDPDAVLWGMHEAVKSDELNFLLDKGWPRHLSPCVLALAMRHLHRTQVFQPQPSELHEACMHALPLLLTLHSDLTDCAKLRRMVDEALIEDGPKHRWPKACDNQDDQFDHRRLRALETALAEHREAKCPTAW